MQNGTTTMENHMVGPQKIKNIIITWSSHSTSGYISTRIERTDICTPMFIARFTVAKTCKQHNCPSTGERIKIMWYIHAMECYSNFKKKEFLVYDATGAIL